MRDESPGGADSFRLKNIRICRTVSRKIACIVLSHFTLACNFMGVSLQCRVFNRWHVENKGRVIGCGEGILEVGRGWGD